jgi:hypothetical protein
LVLQDMPIRMGTKTTPLLWCKPKIYGYMSKTSSVFNTSYDFRFLSEQRLHFFLFFIKSYNLGRRPCGPDVSASYWTHTTDQNPPLLFCYWWFLRLQCLRRKRLPLVAYCHCNNCLKFICIVLPCQERLSLKS